jgi:hypothetical protein
VNMEDHGKIKLTIPSLYLLLSTPRTENYDDLLEALSLSLKGYNIWRPFRNALGKKDRKVSDEMLSISRFYNVAGTMACRPVLVHVILMSIIFEHYKHLDTLRRSV